MQTVTYQVTLPVVNQRVNISTTPIQYTVVLIEKQFPPYDNVLIKPVNSDELSRLVIINGKWQVEKYNDDHIITFQPNTPPNIRPMVPNPLYYDLPTANPTNTLIMPQPVFNPYGNQGLNYNIPEPNPNDIRVGDVGTFTTGGRVGRARWYGFTVTKVVKPGKTLEVVFDSPILVGKEQLVTTPAPGGFGWTHHTPEQNKYRTLQYRRPGKWLFKGIPAKDMIDSSIRMGQKLSGTEEGIF